MKAVINEKETQVKPEYPCLMKSQDGDIFFFVREKYGVPLTNTDKGWAYSHETFCDFSATRYIFTPFTGTITLSND